LRGGVEKMEKKIIVPFEKKKYAKEIGIRFERQKEIRGWYGTEEQERQLNTEQNVAAITNTTSDCNENIDYNPYTNVTNNTEQFTEEQYESEHKIWDSVFEKRDNLLALMTMRDYGIPKDTNLRTELLKTLLLINEGNYAFRYAELVNFHSEFAELYPSTRVNDLAHKALTDGGRNWKEQIRTADITEEEKLLLNLALPI